MLSIYLYHGDLYSDLWNSDLYFTDPPHSIVTQRYSVQIWRKKV